MEHTYSTLIAAFTAIALATPAVPANANGEKGQDAQQESDYNEKKGKEKRKHSAESEDDRGACGDG